MMLNYGFFGATAFISFHRCSSVFIGVHRCSSVAKNLLFFLGDSLREKKNGSSRIRVKRVGLAVRLDHLAFHLCVSLYIAGYRLLLFLAGTPGVIATGGPSPSMEYLYSAIPDIEISPVGDRCASPACVLALSRKRVEPAMHSDTQRLERNRSPIEDSLNPALDGFSRKLVKNQKNKFATDGHR